MRRLLILLILLAAYAFGPQIYAQDTAKNATKPAETEKKATPAEVIISADAALKLRDSAQQAALKDKEAENLSLRIKIAMSDLEKLKAEAAQLQQAANAAYIAAAIKAGVPPGDEREYEGAINEKTGEMVLKRKPAPAPPPKAAKN